MSYKDFIESIGRTPGGMVLIKETYNYFLGETDNLYLYGDFEISKNAEINDELFNFVDDPDLFFDIYDEIMNG